MSDGAITLETLRGAAIGPVLPDLARLRIAVFREFPYLYDGAEAAERRYLGAYAESRRAAIIVARDGAQVVGAATCLPLADETAAIQAPFRAAGIDPATVWYFGESVLLPAWRGKGIGVGFFAARLAVAQADPSARLAAFCAIERPADHQARPASWQPLDSFWRRRGFVRYRNLTCTMSWKEIGEPHETAKTLVFWLHAMNGDALP